MRQAIIGTTVDCSAGNPGLYQSVEDARAQALALAWPAPQTETVPLLSAVGRVLAEPILATHSMPPFDNAAMDGYAVQLSGMPSSAPARLRITDKLLAGDNRDVEATPGTAVRIFTGAWVPDGFDAVIMQERCRANGKFVEFDVPPSLGQNIRRRGEDVDHGQEIVPKGRLLDAAAIAILAANGTEHLTVHSRLKVALISTGNELRDPGQSLAPGQIYNSNRYMLHALLAEPWIDVNDLGIVPDEPDRMRETLLGAANDSADVILTTGGVSAGDADHVLDVLSAAQAELAVLKVAMRPGKPLKIGRLGDSFFAGLPGNPFAAAMTFLSIVQPALRRIAGLTGDAVDWCPAVSSFRYQKKGGRTEYVPVTFEDRDEFGRPLLRQLGRGSSASLLPFTSARGIAVLPADATVIRKGSELRFLPFHR